MAQVTKLVVFMVCVAAAATVMQASGLTAELGQQPNPGVQDNVNDSQEDLKQYSASREQGETSFIGSVISGVDKAIDSFKLVFALYPMLKNLGMPSWLAAFISAPVYFSFGLFVLYLITGRRTTTRI